MTLGVFLAVLFAAFLHASWNAMVKLGTDRFQGMLLMTVCQGLMGAIMVLAVPWPPGEVWPWLIASGVFHSVYKLFLAAAYEHGDLSRVYPIARGAAPMMVAVVSALFLSDAIGGTGYLAILLIGIGILLLARGVFLHGESVRLVPLALGSAACTAGYSLVDGIGARVWGDATAYVGWLFLLDGLIFTAVAMITRGRPALPRAPALWRRGALAGAVSLAAYWIAVWAMTVAPIALVAALRETSVIFALAIGIIWMGERADRGKLVASVLVLAGMVAMRL